MTCMLTLVSWRTLRRGLEAHLLTVSSLCSLYSLPPHTVQCFKNVEIVEAVDIQESVIAMLPTCASTLICVMSL